MDLGYGDATHPGRVTAVTGTAGAVPVTYDARGAVTSTGTLSGMSYDALGRLVAATVSGGGVVVGFAYDPQGRRVLKDVRDGGALRRTRCLAGLWEESDAGTVRHVYLGSRLLASVTTPNGGPATRVTHVCDHHGTVLASVDDTGAVVAWQRYSPFGASLDAAQPLDRYLGRASDDELGLLQLGARYYDPSTGRFLAPDWFVLENPGKVVRLPQGFAVYAYALNNPLSFKDPSGLWFASTTSSSPRSASRSASSPAWSTASPTGRGGAAS